jgi:hypothetical protein
MDHDEFRRRLVLVEPEWRLVVELRTQALLLYERLEESTPADAANTAHALGLTHAGFERVLGIWRATCDPCALQDVGENSGAPPPFSRNPAPIT